MSSAPPTTDLLQASGGFLLQHADLPERVDQTPHATPPERLPPPRAYLQGQLLDVSEQLDVLLRQVLVSGQLLILVAPVAAFLIV